MAKFFKYGSLFTGLLVLVLLPFPFIQYANSVSKTYAKFSLFECLFGNSEYGIKFNIIILILLLICILSGLISLFFKNKLYGYLTSMFAYIFSIIISVFFKFYFLGLNKNYKYINVKDANKVEYGLLIMLIILAIGSYFSYMSMTYEYDKIKLQK